MSDGFHATCATLIYIYIYILLGSVPVVEYVPVSMFSLVFIFQKLEPQRVPTADSGLSSRERALAEHLREKVGS